MIPAFVYALPIALGTILATVPLLAIPLLLVTRPDRSALHGFILGWLAGFYGLGMATILLADAATLYDDAKNGLILLRIALGVLLLYFAWKKWQKRPLPGQDPETPGWMKRFDSISARGAATIGAALATINPKNTVLVMSAALTIAAATPRPAAQAGAFLLHMLVASAGVLAPLIAVTLLGDRALAPLGKLRDAIARHGSTVFAVLFGALGLYVILKAAMDMGVS
ncbi:MAG: GAP family protein [Rubellimicrobium sp.]|nr:GAP family protein [Rubellimicrobium sp.]